MEISFCSHPNTNKVIVTIFGTWHDSWAVVACAKFCCDVIISNWIRAKWIFHHIWIVMEKSLVKWVPEPEGLTILVLKPQYSGITRSIPRLMMPGFLHHQAISNHDIIYMQEKFMLVFSVLRKNVKCKHIFVSWLKFSTGQHCYPEDSPWPCIFFL